MVRVWRQNSNVTESIMRCIACNIHGKYVHMNMRQHVCDKLKRYADDTDRGNTGKGVVLLVLKERHIRICCSIE